MQCGAVWCSELQCGCSVVQYLALSFITFNGRSSQFIFLDVSAHLIMVALSCNQGFYVRDTTASFSVNLYCEWREKNIKEKKLSVSSLYLSMYQLYYRLI